MDIFVVDQNIVAIAFYEGPSSIKILAWVKHFIVSLLVNKQLSIFVK